ncbi:ParB/RepB/Spo0J family partition protein [Paenibacillus sp. Y412MC10]|uniref:ParB/RepB/Spo0J family partition protein n=2 Tax=Bacillati TaxID=1783272 RepID=UPI001642B3EA|nr:ParB/RepB/Spo0J family partition protein [Paenibacillus sp. Y412MC10]
MVISNEIVMLPIAELKNHPRNDEYNSALEAKEEAALKASIVEAGIQEPLLVREDYTIISGHQRRRIAAELGMEHVPTRIVTCTEEESIYLLVSANMARRGDEKDYIKQAMRAEVLYAKWGIHPGRKSVHDAQFSRHDVASSLGLNDSSVRRLMRLLLLIPEFRKEVSKGAIGLIGGNKIASLSEEKQRLLFQEYEKRDGKIKNSELEDLILQVDDSDTLRSLQEEKQERREAKAGGEVQKIEKQLERCMSDGLSDSQREDLISILEDYTRKLRELKGAMASGQ